MKKVPEAFANGDFPCINQINYSVMLLLRHAERKE
jgi:hypothetical protein